MGSYFAFVAMLIPTLLVLALAAVTVVADDFPATPVNEVHYQRGY